MYEIKPPNWIIDNRAPSLFLAGSIEMGEADDWQSRVVTAFANANVDVTILNPRPDDWDSSAKQSIDDEYFRNQVEWELRGLESCDAILMYLQPGTKSPISLLELGLFAKKKKMAVVCPEGFWRKGNVDIVCRRYGVLQFDSLQSAIDSAVQILRGKAC